MRGRLGWYTAGTFALALYLIGAESVFGFEKPPPALKALITLEKPASVPTIPFLTEEGKQAFVGDYSGRTVVINFWATWCAPCIKEMPSLDRLAAKLPPERFAVITLNQDAGGSPVARSFLERLGLRNLPASTDPNGRLARALGSRGLPTTFIVDPSGRVVARLEGIAEWDQPEAVDFLASIAR